MLSLLLIDDDPNLRRVTELQLNDLGYKVKTADSGEEGLKMVRNNNFDVVVTDVIMPGIDGMEVLRRLNSEFPELKIEGELNHEQDFTINATIYFYCFQYLLSHTSEVQVK